MGDNAHKQSAVRVLKFERQLPYWLGGIGLLLVPLAYLLLNPIFLGYLPGPVIANILVWFFSPWLIGIAAVTLMRRMNRSWVLTAVVTTILVALYGYFAVLSMQAAIGHAF